jgi:hypothetical protein
MADKDFKVKTGLDLPAPLPILEGGTGQTTANNALNAMLPSQTTHGSKILGTDGTNTTWVNPGAAYQTSAPDNPVTGQLWVDSDETGDSLDPYIIRRKTITATAGQTVFTTDVVFTDGYEQIYYNGVLLVRTTDYTTNGGTNTVTLLQGASAGDTVEIISSTPINLINTATTSTNTFTGIQTIENQLRVGSQSLASVSGANPLQGISISNIGAVRPRLGLFDEVGTNASGTSLGTIEWFDRQRTIGEKRAAIIEVIKDGSTSGQRGGAIVLSTVPDSSNSIIERMRINSAGNVGVGWAPDNNWHLSVNSSGGAGAGAFLSTSSTNIIGALFENTNASFTNNLVKSQTHRSNNSGFIYYSAVSNVASTGDTDWYVRGDGQVFTDGSTSMSSPADYAEYFEWADGNIENQDRSGYSVSLVNGTQIKIAEEGESIIGIVSANPAVIGDAAWNMWTGKYEKDEFNRYVRDENGDRILSSEFDPEAEYISRENRPEWSPVGMVGKLRMRKGQLTDPRWIKMRDISAEVEEWLVR